jgi:hypothetical protein
VCPDLRGAVTLAVATTIAVAAEHVACSWLGTAASIAGLVLATLGSCLDRQASKEQQTEEHRNAHDVPTERLDDDWMMTR